MCSYQNFPAGAKQLLYFNLLECKRLFRNNKYLHCCWFTCLLPLSTTFCVLRPHKHPSRIVKTHSAKVHLLDFALITTAVVGHAITRITYVPRQAYMSIHFCHKLWWKGMEMSFFRGSKTWSHWGSYSSVGKGTGMRRFSFRNVQNPCINKLQLSSYGNSTRRNFFKDCL